MVKKSVKVKSKYSGEKLGIAGFSLGVFSLGFFLGFLSVFMALTGSVPFNIFIDIVFLMPIVGLIFGIIQQVRNPKKISKAGLIINIVTLVLITSLILIYYLILIPSLTSA